MQNAFLGWKGGLTFPTTGPDRGLGGQSGQGGQGGLGGAESSVPHRDFHGITCESGSPRATPKPLYVTDNKSLLPVCSLNYENSPSEKEERTFSQGPFASHEKQQMRHSGL